MRFYTKISYSSAVTNKWLCTNNLIIYDMFEDNPTQLARRTEYADIDVLIASKEDEIAHLQHTIEKLNEYLSISRAENVQLKNEIENWAKKDESFIESLEKECIEVRKLLSVKDVTFAQMKIEYETLLEQHCSAQRVIEMHKIALEQTKNENISLKMTIDSLQVSSAENVRLKLEIENWAKKDDSFIQLLEKESVELKALLAAKDLEVTQIQVEHQVLLEQHLTATRTEMRQIREENLMLKSKIETWNHQEESFISDLEQEMKELRAALAAGAITVSEITDQTNEKVSSIDCNSEETLVRLAKSNFVGQQQSSLNGQLIEAGGVHLENPQNGRHLMDLDEMHQLLNLKERELNLLRGVLIYLLKLYLE